MAGERFSHPVPGDLMENKEKFLRFFSVTSIIAICIAFVPGIAIFALLSPLGGAFKVAAIVIWIVLEAGAYIVTMGKRDINVHRYNGGGRYIYQVWIERLRLRKRRALYIKGYDKIYGDGGKRK